jgi:hypothetical protein
LFDGLLVEGVGVGAGLLAVPLVGAAGALVGAGAVVEELAGASFFSPAVAGVLSPSDGGFSLFE